MFSLANHVCVVHVHEQEGFCFQVIFEIFASSFTTRSSPNSGSSMGSSIVSQCVGLRLEVISAILQLLTCPLVHTLGLRRLFLLPEHLALLLEKQMRLALRIQICIHGCS